MLAAKMLAISGSFVGGWATDTVADPQLAASYLSQERLCRVPHAGARASKPWCTQAGSVGALGLGGSCGGHSSHGPQPLDFFCRNPIGQKHPVVAGDL